MSFDAFSNNRSPDHRARRLALSVLAAALICTGGLSLFDGEASHAHAKATEADDTIDVKLADLPREDPRPEPQPTPAPAAPALLVPKSVKINPNAPPQKPITTPTEIPKNKLKEADPSQDKGVAGVHEGGDVTGKAGGKPGGTGTATAAAPPPPPPPTAPAPAPEKPRQIAISEDTEPPVPLSQPRPRPPPEFIAAGEDAVVVVKFTITESGDVADVRIVKGHPMLDSLVSATVRTWKFKPATSQGRPVAYPKTVKIPFRIKT